ncbi:MAG: hypothetical protein KIY12_03290, partial [Thermoplasmata archaeon]|nr:hypothetical protein [Candidatus Sysuiplasma superficiale]
MSCLLCGEEISGDAAICTSCAFSNLEDEWYSEKASDGYFRLRGNSELVAVLSEESFELTPGSDDFNRRMDALPDTAEGYRTAAGMMTEVLNDLGIRNGNFILPRFENIAGALRKLEGYEEHFPGTADREFYIAMAKLYRNAAVSFHLPLVPEGFSESRKRALQGKASYWESKVSVDGEEKLEAGIGGVESAAAAPPAGEAEPRGDIKMLAPKVEMLRERIRSIETAISSLQSQAKARRDSVPENGADLTDGETATAPEEGAEYLRKRVRTGYIAGLYAEALEDSFSLLRTFRPERQDLLYAVLCSLRLNDRSRAEEALARALETGLYEYTDMVKAIFSWKDGKWGLALQRLDAEIGNFSSAAAFILKLNICAQYGITDREGELREQQKRIGDIAEGVNLISQIYLALGMWGAAIQSMNAVPMERWNDEAYSAFGMALEDRGDEPGAVRAYDRALEINAKNSTALIRKGLIMARSANHASALQLFSGAT